MSDNDTPPTGNTSPVSNTPPASNAWQIKIPKKPFHALGVILSRSGGALARLAGVIALGWLMLGFQPGCRTPALPACGEIRCNSTPTQVEPKPAPAPISDAGFRVLIIYESSELSKYAPSQIEAMRAQSVRKYLDDHCVKVDGLPEWRVWDKDTDTSGASVLWQTAMKRPYQSLPWVIISNGKTGFEGPLPKTPDEFLSLLQKYGGS